MSTESSDHMHKLADVTAATVLFSLLLFIGLSILGIFSASLSSVGTTWFALYSLIVVMSATKLYGKSVYEAVKSAGGSLVNINNK